MAGGLKKNLALRWPVAVGLLFVAALAVGLGILRFGNPQWHKRIYLFQEYRWPGRGDVSPPEGYTGLWRGWHEDGHLRVEMHYRNGAPHGKYTLWREDGKKCTQGEFTEGRAQGVWRYWDQDGNLYLAAEP